MGVERGKLLYSPSVVLTGEITLKKLNRKSHVIASKEEKTQPLAGFSPVHPGSGG